MLKYNARDRGIKILELDGAFQLCTKQEYYEYLVEIALQPKKAVLTDVMLETLSIIAYKQPVTKQEIEKIRGVKCDHAINKLVEYNLVQELGRLDAPGRPILFGTTEEFLRNFGVQSTEDLPTISPVKMEDFKAEAGRRVSCSWSVQREKPGSKKKEKMHIVSLETVIKNGRILYGKNKAGIVAVAFGTGGNTDDRIWHAAE